MGRVLDQKFFNQPTLKVAENLLGKYLVRRLNKKNVAVMITEVEAYDGPLDKASHASRVKTERNQPMFGPAGYFYVYFTYGMHWMLNIVTGPKNYPAAILIRGGVVRISPRSVSISPRLVGPARLTKFLKIDKRFNNKKANRKAGLWFEDRGLKIKKSQIKRVPRVGVSYAGPIWSKKPYRFILHP